MQTRSSSSSVLRCGIPSLMVALAACGTRDSGSDARAPTDSALVAAAAAMTGPCDDFSTDQYRFVDATIGVELTRSSNWEDSHGLKLQHGKGVGRMKNTGRADLAPGLPAGREGCLRFKRTRQGVVTAKLHILGTGGGPVNVDNAVICWDRPHDDNVRPAWHAVADVPCRYLEFSFPNGPDTLSGLIAFPDESPTRQQAMDRVLARLRELRGVAPLSPQDSAWVRRVVGPLFLAGPWFPCAISGCCRGYN